MQNPGLIESCAAVDRLVRNSVTPTQGNSPDTREQRLKKPHHERASARVKLASNRSFVGAPEPQKPNSTRSRVRTRTRIKAHACQLLLAQQGLQDEDVAVLHLLALQRRPAARTRVFAHAAHSVCWGTSKTQDAEL